MDLNRGDVNSAIGKFSAVLDKKPDFYKAEGHLGLALDSVGRKDEALKHYLKALSAREKKWEVAYNAANIMMLQKDYPGAARYFALSLDLKPENPEAHNNLGMVYKLSGNYPQAISSFEKAIALDPRHAYAHFNLAESYYLSGNKVAASAMFARTKAKFPALTERIDSFLSVSK
jgi:Flp pilus assembly protein TadD